MSETNPETTAPASTTDSSSWVDPAVSPNPFGETSHPTDPTPAPTGEQSAPADETPETPALVPMDPGTGGSSVSSTPENDGTAEEPSVASQGKVRVQLEDDGEGQSIVLGNHFVGLSPVEIPAEMLPLFKSAAEAAGRKIKEL